jgi:multicomponent Na+:H+ antiporter subunit B
VSPAARSALFLSGAGVLAVLLALALIGLPDFDAPLGPVADVIAKHAVSERKATNTVMAVTFDYRGLDTLGEEFMIFTAALGAAVLLRTTRDEGQRERATAVVERRIADTSDLLRVVGGALAPVTIVVGIYVVAHGHLTPGGGFQGGVVLAAAFLLAFVAGRHMVTGPVRPLSTAEIYEAVGAGAFALIGIGGLVFATALLENFLPLGMPGDLLSAGTIPVLNVAVGLEVAAAFTVILMELLDQLGHER